MSLRIGDDLYDCSLSEVSAFIDGTYKKPGDDSTLLPLWQRCNDLVLSWLLNSLHNNIKDIVLFCEIASELWKDLNEGYGQSNKVRLF